MEDKDKEIDRLREAGLNLAAICSRAEVERDELRQQNSNLRIELEKLNREHQTIYENILEESMEESKGFNMEVKILKRDLETLQKKLEKLMTGNCCGVRWTSKEGLALFCTLPKEHLNQEGAAQFHADEYPLTSIL